MGPGHPLYEKVAAAYQAERNRVENAPEALERTRRNLDSIFGRWFGALEQMWLDRMALLGIDWAGPDYAARVEALKAEGRWPQIGREQFGIRLCPLPGETPPDQPAR